MMYMCDQHPLERLITQVTRQDLCKEIKGIILFYFCSSLQKTELMKLCEILGLG